MARGLSSLTLPVLIIVLFYSSLLVNCQNGTMSCTSVLDMNLTECINDSQRQCCYHSCMNTTTNTTATCRADSSTGEDIQCLLATSCDSEPSTSSDEPSTGTAMAVSTEVQILGLPRTRFIIIVAAAGGGAILLVTLLLLLCLCCYCCHKKNKKRLENLKMKLIEQPDVDKSPSRRSNATSPARELVNVVQPLDNSVELKVNEAQEHENSPGVPPSSLTELVPLSANAFSSPKSKSIDNIRESALSDPPMRPKADSDAYLKMSSAGSIRPSKSCQDFVEDEEIYVEPDQNLHQSCDAVSPTKSNTAPKKQPKPSPGTRKPEIVYGNQETIDKQSVESENYENVVPPADGGGESYTSVSEFLRGHTERNIEEEEGREYYNYIPGGSKDDEMYVYMQSGIAGTEGQPSSDKSRLRNHSGNVSSSTVKYMNLSSQDKLNSCLPGAEYGEPGDNTTVPVATNGTGQDDKEQPIYANCSDDEELYTAMS